MSRLYRLPGQNRIEPSSDLSDLLRADAVLHRMAVPLDGAAGSGQFSACIIAQ